MDVLEVFTAGKAQWVLGNRFALYTGGPHVSAQPGLRCTNYGAELFEGGVEFGWDGEGEA